MDICSQIGLSDTDNANNLHGLCMDTLDSTHGILKALSVDELGDGVTEFLKIQDNTEEDSISSPPPKSFESNQSKITTQASKKRLSKHATFPSSSTTSPSPPNSTTSKASPTHAEDNVKSRDPSSFRSISMPTHLKPVSAMKGSREKRGEAPAVKLSVKWAPDVYDPIPTSVSHVVTNNRSSRHSSSKKKSKNKEKNGSKSSRGSKGKDKKQVRKRGGNSSGSSSMGYKLVEHEKDQVVDFREHDGIDFHVGNHDQFCGSSFLNRYGTSLHLSSVAEVT